MQSCVYIFPVQGNEGVFVRKLRSIDAIVLRDTLLFYEFGEVSINGEGGVLLKTLGDVAL